MYSWGKGVEVDYILAYMRYSLAIDQGYDVKSLRNNLAKDMTPEQITEAQEMA